MFDNFLFLASTLMAVGGAFGVVINKNLMHACIYLLVSLFGIAGLYATLGADFLAATQLVVYAGGVVILMLFAVMLTGGTQNAINKFGIKKTPGMGSTFTYSVAGMTVVFIAIVILKLIAGQVRAMKPIANAAPLPTTEKIGELLLTDYILAFEISSILLLGALVGAAVIARPRKGQKC